VQLAIQRAGESKLFPVTVLLHMRIGRVRQRIARFWDAVPTFGQILLGRCSGLRGIWSQERPDLAKKGERVHLLDRVS